MRHNVLTKITGIIIFLVVAITQLNQAKWQDPNGVITGDVRGYYAYLPALFINNDLKLQDLSPYNQDKSTEIWFSKAKDGTKFIKFTCGMAIIYSPFFAAGHAYALNSKYDANGFSAPYKVALSVASLVYLIISLIFITKVLRLYFTEITTSLTLFIIFLGSNYFHYVTGSMTYSHGFSFALISVFMYATIKWLAFQKFKWAIIIGLTAGLIILIRPIDVLFVLFIPLVHVSSLSDLRQRLILFWNTKRQILIMIFFAFLMILPQLLYFKYISGSFIFYSYDDESFFFLQPKLIDAFFSYRNGWLLYSPLMIFAVIGLLINKLTKRFRIYTLIVFTLYSFVVVSWWCWWYVGIGNRAFINLYPLLAISMAGFITWVANRNRKIKFTFGVIVLFGILLNIKQNAQANKGAIHWDSMTKAAYWDSFGREKPSQIFYTLLEKPITSFAMKRENIVEYTSVDTVQLDLYSYNDIIDCDSITRPYFQPKGGFRNTGGLRVQKGVMYCLQHVFEPHPNASHLYISTWVSNPEDIHLVVEGVNGLSFYAAASEISEIKDGWSKLHLYVKLPPAFNDKQFRFYVWNKSAHEFKFDELSLLHTKHELKLKHN
ncbi:MAG: hypothetical protein MK105_03425 [Crocinitomicaceae bacterium]|nr:hypothetical protein [Crocinitomicaceae bacterium]